MPSSIRGWRASSAMRWRRTVNKPLRMLIDTHCHLDHTHGNVVFEDLPILAHEKTLTAMHGALGPRSGDRWTITDFPTKLRMLFGQNIMELVPDGDPAQAWFKQRISLPDYDTVTILPPTQTFADQFAFHLPNETVHLHYWGPAHCDGDIVVHLEKAKVVFLGDLLFHGRFPWLGDCDLDGWIDRLARVLKLDVAVVDPGARRADRSPVGCALSRHADRAARCGGERHQGGMVGGRRRCATCTCRNTPASTATRTGCRST